MLSHPGDYEPLGFIDDDPAKRGQSIHGVTVMGTRDDLAAIIARHRPHEILVAMPGADPATVRAVVTLLQPFKIPITTLPGVQDVLEGRVAVSQVRELTIADLLPRAPIELDTDAVRRLISRKRVLVTGAGGSIGSELSRQLAAFDPEGLILFERYENALHDVSYGLSCRFPAACVHPVIGDVTDAARVEQVLAEYEPHLIFHAAAHKHVPLMESHPCEAIKNNVIGTATVAQAASAYGVERFILISTDKAVNPSSVMGATKRVAEMTVQMIGRQSQTRFATVRFGNVLGSNGSVLPRFLEQIKAGGPVTVTHPEIRRFFMLIPEAVQLVLHAAALGEPGMTYVLEMGDQIKLDDLARNLIHLAGYVPDIDIPIKYVGLRPGEKLFEELIGSGEIAEPSPVPKILQIRGACIDESPLWSAQVSALIRLAADGDAAAAVAQLRRIVPTFPHGTDEILPAAAAPGAVAWLPAPHALEHGVSRQFVVR
jgi:FlaA1/EpsC-like NDP-sugar epimerase